jgi:hypothetical protein
MNLPLQPVLAFILFLPAFAVLGARYVLFPRRPRGSLRMIADVLVLLATAACSLWAMRRGFAGALEAGGAMWAQIFATLVAYGVFLGALGAAALVRALVLRARRIG